MFKVDITCSKKEVLTCSDSEGNWGLNSSNSFEASLWMDYLEISRFDRFALCSTSAQYSIPLLKSKFDMNEVDAYTYVRAVFGVRTSNALFHCHYLALIVE